MSRIDRADLRTIDLNLLVAFAALMQTRSVTRAAERLGVGQPSASHALKRLRDLFGDPLFVRTPAGMTPTPRALALDEPVRSILASIEATLATGPAFDPGRESRIFRLGANDYAQSVIADPLLAILRDEAPGCKLILTASDCDVVGRALERGDIDLAVGVFPELASEPHQRRLYRERYQCVFDAEACGIEGPLTFEQWLATPHLIMSTRADYAGPLDEVLKARGERREVVASTPNFLAIPYLLKGKRLLAALPSRLAKACGPGLGLTVCDLPMAAAPFDVVMIWTARTANEPGAVWLRERIVAACENLGDDPEDRS